MSKMAFLMRCCFIIVVTLLVSEVECRISTEPWDKDLDAELIDSLMIHNDDAIPDDEYFRSNVLLVEEDGGDENEDGADYSGNGVEVTDGNRRKKRDVFSSDTTQFSWYKKSICWKLCKKPTKYPAWLTERVIGLAMSKWSAASGNVMQFPKCPDSRTCEDKQLGLTRDANSPADISISFVCNDERPAYKFASSHILGHAYVPWPCHSLGGDIHINDCHNLRLIATDTARSVYMVLMHEVGHALGLRAHSENKADIMYSGHTPIGLPHITPEAKERFIKKYSDMWGMTGYERWVAMKAGFKQCITG